jgi:hypothetical protein
VNVMNGTRSMIRVNRRKSRKRGTIDLLMIKTSASKSIMTKLSLDSTKILKTMAIEIIVEGVSEEAVMVALLEVEVLNLEDGVAVVGVPSVEVSQEEEAVSLAIEEVLEATIVAEAEEDSEVAGLEAVVVTTKGMGTKEEEIKSTIRSLTGTVENE